MKPHQRDEQRQAVAEEGQHRQRNDHERHAGLEVDRHQDHRFEASTEMGGEEAQRSLNDLLRLEAKDAESSQRERDKKKKELALDKEKKPCVTLVTGWMAASEGRLATSFTLVRAVEKWAMDLPSALK